MVITRVEYKDHLTLRIVPATGTDAGALGKKLKTTAREALKFRPTIEVLPSNALPPDSPPIHDERTWE